MLTSTRKVVILGATGTIGSAVSYELRKRGYDVIVVSRNTEKARLSLPGMHEYVLLDFSNPSPLQLALENAVGVINLSGEPLLGNPFSKKHKKLVYSSRVQVTEQLVVLLKGVTQKPAVFINGSAIGFYGFHTITDQEYAEDSPPSTEYQGFLTKKWEDAAEAAQRLRIRVVCIRTGIVLDLAQNGALKKLLLPFYWYLGGYIGIANSWRSWIHLDDEVGIILHALTNSSVVGGINATAPHPVTNREFAKCIGKALNKPSAIPVPEIFVRIIFGELAEVITRGKKVLPAKALSTEYQFKYPTLSEALKNLL